MKGKLPSEQPLEQTQPDPDKEAEKNDTSDEEDGEENTESEEILNKSDDDEVSVLCVLRHISKS